MKYTIKTFVFDTEQLLLTQAGEVIALRMNEAKLLALLLSEPGKLFSKEEILDKVWVGKVVAEQAVFQNIRHLRAVFGEESIKTFSKKGYQWQLPLTQVGSDEAGSIPLNSISLAKPFFPKRIVASLVLGCLLSVAVMVWHSYQATASLPSIALLPLISGGDVDPEVLDSLRIDLENTDGFTQVIANNQKVPEDFFWAPQKYFPALSQAAQVPYVAVAKVTQQPEGLRVRYQLNSRTATWRAEHQAPTAAALAGLMKQHLQVIVNSGLLEIDQQNAVLRAAQLKLLHNEYSQDLNLVYGLIDLHLRIGDAASARVLARFLQSESSRQQDKLMLAKGYLAEAKVYTSENLLADAELLLAKAESVFSTINDKDNLAEVEHERIVVALTHHNYDQVQAHIQRALEYVRRAGDVLGEYRFNTWAAVLAHKFQRDQDSSAYLDDAKAVLDKHQRDADLYGLIHFYAGMFAQDEATAEVQYRTVLELIPADQDWWERERAQVHLSELLIKQSRWQDAQDLYANQELDAAEELQVGKIWLAQREWTKAEAHGIRAFEQANMNGQLQNALDAAAYLLQLDKRQGRSADSFYQQFLLEQAANVPLWIRFNQSTIAELGLALQEP
ncbi:winged helix-turn-helix domain-containing protein [Cellvibrio sp. UBA7661]|uniref:winged helix-turn-helix domain-containing protein n=1 Tax=Cellvibrio sp. UBA7661 TaxID=1946311 RepID=UPI002F35DB7C